MATITLINRSKSKNNRSLTNNLVGLEGLLHKQLLTFYNLNIRGSMLSLEYLKHMYNTTIHDIIRSSVQEPYLLGHRTVGSHMQKHNKDFQLYISGTDTDNIKRITDRMVNNFWNTSNRLIEKERTEKIVNNNIIQKRDPNVESAILGLSSMAVFSGFNSAVKSKMGAVNQSQSRTAATARTIRTLTSPRTDQIIFTTKHDAKVDQEICAPLDGTIWDVTDPDIVIPPEDTHPFCRCVLLPFSE